MRSSLSATLFECIECRQSLSYACLRANIGPRRLTGIQHAISILDLREVRHVIARDPQTRIDRDPTCWFTLSQCNIQIRLPTAAFNSAWHATRRAQFSRVIYVCQIYLLICNIFEEFSYLLFIIIDLYRGKRAFDKVRWILYVRMQ